jgi:hypothetical protein
VGPSEWLEYGSGDMRDHGLPLGFGDVGFEHDVSDQTLSSSLLHIRPLRLPCLLRSHRRDEETSQVHLVQQVQPGLVGGMLCSARLEVGDVGSESRQGFRSGLVVDTEGWLGMVACG